MLNDPRIITQALDQTPTAPTTPQKEQENSCPADQVETACGPGARGQGLAGARKAAWPAGSSTTRGRPTPAHASLAGPLGQEAGQLECS